MTRYAQATSVSVEKSRSEIETTLTRYGANKFAYARDDERGIASIEFEAHDRHVRFILNLPKQTADQFQYTNHSNPKRRNPDAVYKLWEQACRQRWRALLLVVKAKLEAVESDITTFEHEFMAHIVMPNGQTLGNWVIPQIKAAYESGDMPQLLIEGPM